MATMTFATVIMTQVGADLHLLELDPYSRARVGAPLALRLTSDAPSRDGGIRVALRRLRAARSRAEETRDNSHSARLVTRLRLSLSRS